MAHDEELTFMEHLEDLRDRLIKMALALAAGMLVSTFFAKRLLAFLIAPLGEHVPQAYAPTAPMVMFFKVSIVCGAALAMPVIVYQFLRFIVPGLKPQERGYLYIVVPGASLCFLAGVAFAYLALQEGDGRAQHDEVGKSNADQEGDGSARHDEVQIAAFLLGQARNDEAQQLVDDDRHSQGRATDEGHFEEHDHRRGGRVGLRWMLS